MLSHFQSMNYCNCLCPLGLHLKGNFSFIFLDPSICHPFIFLLLFFFSQSLGLSYLLSPVCYMVIALFVAGMLSPTKEKGSGFGSKQLHKIQNMLHHRPRSGSWGHKHEKEKNEKISKYTCYNVLLNNAQGP